MNPKLRMDTGPTCDPGIRKQLSVMNRSEHAGALLESLLGRVEAAWRPNRDAHAPPGPLAPAHSAACRACQGHSASDLLAAQNPEKPCSKTAHASEYPRAGSYGVCAPRILGGVVYPSALTAKARPGESFNDKISREFLYSREF